MTTSSETADVGRNATAPPGVLLDVSLPAAVHPDTGSSADAGLRQALVDDLDAGFAALVRRHQGFLLGVARRTTGHAADAEDVTAEAFLRAYRALRTYEPTRIAALDLRAWLVTVLLNVRRNEVRAAARRPRIGDGTPADRPSTDPSPAEQGDPDLARALADLPPVQRSAVVLRHVADLAVPDVAAALGCGEGTARSHVSRGLARLRAALGPDTDPDTDTGPGPDTGPLPRSTP